MRQLPGFLATWGAGWGRGGEISSSPAEGVLGSVWFLCNRYTPYPNLYPDQSPSEDWTMEERFRPLTLHGLILRSQLVTLLVRGVCYSESQSVSLSGLCWGPRRHGVAEGRSLFPAWGRRVPAGCCQVACSSVAPSAVVQVSQVMLSGAGALPATVPLVCALAVKGPSGLQTFNMLSTLLFLI